MLSVEGTVVIAELDIRHDEGPHVVAVPIGDQLVRLELELQMGRDTVAKGVR